jgi:hypothetical protein
MNTANSITGSGGVVLTEWLRRIGLSRSTGGRWRGKGWIQPSVNIAGQLYMTDADIAAFWERAAAGEFAKDPDGIIVQQKLSA